MIAWWWLLPAAWIGVMVGFGCGGSRYVIRVAPDWAEREDIQRWALKGDDHG